MDHETIRNLKEWAPLSELLNKIPGKIQKNVFFQELDITCIDIQPDFIAIGSNVGIVFWYNRCTGAVLKLRSEVTSAITCVKIVSTVEFMIAAGNASGQVNVFQIQKEIPSDLNLSTPLTKSKPIERYTIRDLHKSSVKCIEWSKNGMKLFSGDKNGIIVLTEFDFGTHISKSMEILNEAYEIVQLSFRHSLLLVSTIYRAIICEKEQDGQWKVSQVGKKDRKILSNFGISFYGNKLKPYIITARPGFRFWLSDKEGNVSQTFLLKDAVVASTTNAYEISLLNPGRVYNQPALSQFGKCFIFKESWIVTHNDNVVYFLNLEKLKVEATIRRLRKIQCLSICDNEIFILEGARSIVRISTEPEPPNKTCSKIIFNPLMGGQYAAAARQVDSLPIEFEAEDEIVVSAEECFELPPVAELTLDTPLRTALSEHDLLQQDKLLLEHSRKVEVYEKISQLDFDDSILFKTGASKRKKSKGERSRAARPKSTPCASGIVEIGQLADVQDAKEKTDTNQQQNGFFFSAQIDASFCDGASIVPADLKSPDDTTNVLASAERSFAIAHNIKPVNCNPVPLSTIAPTKITPDLVPQFHYPLNYFLYDENIPPRTPLKKIHFIESPEEPILTNLCDDEKSICISHFDDTSELDVISDMPKITKLPDYMAIPNLWNVNIIKANDGTILPINDSKITSAAKNNNNGDSLSDDDGATYSDWEII